MPTFLSVMLVMVFIVLLVTGALSVLRELTATLYSPTKSPAAGDEEVAQYPHREPASPLPPGKNGHTN